MKVPQERIGFPDHFKMNPVGIGQQDQTVVTGKVAEQFFRDQSFGKENGTPYVAETVVWKGDVHTPAVLIGEFLGRDPALLELIGEVSGPGFAKPGSRLAGERFESNIDPVEVKRHDHASQVEND